MTEKQKLTEFLMLYKDHPCLWDPTHKSFHIKFNRQKAYEALLENYRTIYPLASMDTLKQRIQNMRSAYKREHRKVLASFARGQEKYEPNLWYYHLMKFIDAMPDTGKDNDSPASSTSGSEVPCQFLADYLESDAEEEEPPKKKTKKISSTLPEPNDTSRMSVSQSHTSLASGSKHSQGDGGKEKTESKAFANLIAMQLGEVTSMQRFIAEKLISDILYYARLEKLNTDSAVTLYKEE